MDVSFTAFNKQLIPCLHIDTVEVILMQFMMYLLILSSEVYHPFFSNMYSMLMILCIVYLCTHRSHIFGDGVRECVGGMP